MKNYFILILFLISSLLIHAQSSSDNDSLKKTGHGVLVPEYNEDSIYTNPNVFETPFPATYLVKSKLTNAGVYIDHVLCGVKKCSVNEFGEMKFMNRIDNCVGILVAETTEGISINDVDYFVLNNALNKAPDAEITMKEFRVVNGIKVLCLGIKGSIKSLKFEGLTYIYVDESKVIQLTGYTTQKKFPKKKGDIERFLCGLVLLK